LTDSPTESFLLIGLDLLSRRLFLLLPVLLLVVPFVELLMRTQVHVASVNQGCVLAETSAVFFDFLLDQGQSRLVFDCCWEFVLLAFDDLSQNVSQNLAAPGFWQSVDQNHVLEGSHWTDFVSDQLDQLLLDVLDLLIGFEDDKPNGNLTFKFFNFSYNRRLRYSRMADQHLLHLSGRQPVPCSVNDIIQSGHDVQIPVVIIVSSITSRVVSRGLVHVLFQESLIVSVQCEHE